MNDYTVLIPTTQKVVGITHITQEEKDVLPVVCITNELKPLDISNDYKNFVQNPTGIIEKYTNNNTSCLVLYDPMLDLIPNCDRQVLRQRQTPGSVNDATPTSKSLLWGFCLFVSLIN